MRTARYVALVALCGSGALGVETNRSVSSDDLQYAIVGLRSYARKLERLEIKYELRTEVLLANYAESKLEALAGGATRYESIRDVLLKCCRPGQTSSTRASGRDDCT